jgi:type II secretory pathway pseudopilin PulG
MRAPWSAPRRRAGRADRGESLVEVLVTLAIMSIAVVAVVGGMVLAVQTSNLHRQRVTAAAAVRAFAEALQGRVTRTPTGYVDTTCASPASYAGVYTPPAGFVAEVTDVLLWNGTQFVGTCPPDVGLQRVSLRVATTDGRVSESLDVIIRKPCRVGDPPCS